MTMIEQEVSRAEVEEMIMKANDAIHRINALDEETTVMCKRKIISKEEYSALHLNNLNQLKKLQTNYDVLMKILFRMKYRNVTKATIGLVK